MIVTGQESLDQLQILLVQSEMNFTPKQISLIFLTCDRPTLQSQIADADYVQVIVLSK